MKALDGVIAASIRSRPLVIAGALALVVGGVWLARRARLDALPSFTPPMVVVQTEALGYSSLGVEERVTTPIERALLGTPQATKIRSTSSPGLSVVEVTFEEGADVFRARQLVSERIAEAGRRLPEGVDAPELAPITAPVGALIKLCYTTAGDDPAALLSLSQFTEWMLRPRLEALEGVARVTVHGGAPLRVEVRPEPAALVARGTGIEALRSALESGQSAASLGMIDAGTTRAPLRSEGTWSFEALEVISDDLVARRDGRPVRVRDLAEVRLGHAPPVGTALYDGHPAIYVQVDKVPWADTLAVSRSVEDELARLDEELPRGAARTPPTFRQADFVRSSLDAVGRAMGIGAALVVVVLVAFFRSARLALISLTAIPLSVLAAVVTLLAAGAPVNGMVLGGLAMAIGEVVDDAVIDVENVWRRLRENASAVVPRSTLLVVQEASSEVRGAVVYATMIVVVVLTPVLFLGGLAGRIFSPLAQAYALAIAASLVVALTVTPALAAVLLPRLARPEAGETGLARRLRGVYDRVLARVRRRPCAVLLGAASLGVGALALLPFLSGGFLPEFREGVLIAEVSAWPGTSLEETTRLVQRLDLLLRERGLVPHLAARIGRASLDEDAAPAHRAELDLVVPADVEPEELEVALLEAMASLPGVRCGVEGFLGERINELLSGERAPIAVKLTGDDLPALQAAGRRVLGIVSAVEGVETARSEALVDVPVVRLEADDSRLAAAGLRRTDLIAATAALREGLEVAQVRGPGGVRIPLVIAGGDAQRRRDRLPDLPVSLPGGGVLPLSALARVVEGQEPAVVRHEGGRRQITVTVRAPGAALPRIDAEIERRLRDAELGRVSWQVAGSAKERGQAALHLLVVTLLVLVAVFVFLWTAFGSAMDAAVILLGIPMGMVGGIAAALLLPEGLSVAGLVGFVALFGVICRNGIMLVSHKNALHEAMPTASAEDVALQAARERLVPILMTACAGFFGLLPLALSFESAGSELEAPMALIVCGGLLSSTALNLVVVPAVYLWRAGRRGRETSP